MFQWLIATNYGIHGAETSNTFVDDAITLIQQLYSFERKGLIGQLTY